MSGFPFDSPCENCGEKISVPPGWKTWKTGVQHDWGKGFYLGELNVNRRDEIPKYHSLFGMDVNLTCNKECFDKLSAKKTTIVKQPSE